MSQLWFLDSRDRVRGTNEDFYIELRHRINDLRSMTIREIEIPFSHYVFTSSHKIDFNEGAGELTATLTAGNYTYTELIAHLKSIMDTAGTDTYTWSYNSNSSKLTCSSTGTFSFLWSSGSNKGNGIDELLGFTEDGGTAQDSSTASSHTAGYLLNTSGENALYLETTELTANDSKSLSILNNNPKQVVCKIPINVSPGGVVSYSINEPYRMRLKGDMSQIRFRLIDRRSRTVNLNGKSMSLTIELIY